MAAIMRKLSHAMASSAVPAVHGDRDDHEDSSTELEYSFAIEYRGPPLAYDIPNAVPVDLDQIPTAAPVSSASLLHNLSLPVIQPIAKSNPSNKKPREEAKLESEAKPEKAIFSSNSVAPVALEYKNGEKGVSTLSDKLGSSGKLGFSCRLSGSLGDVLELPDDGQEAQGFQSYMSPGNWGSSESGSSSRSLSSEVFSGREEAGGDETPHHVKRPSTVTFRDPDSNDIVQEEEFELSDRDENVQVRPRVERNGTKGSCSRCGKGNRLTDKEVCIVCGAKYCFNCVLRAMGSMPEGRKCVTCIGFGIDESRRKKLGKCSRMLKRLLTKLEVELIMEAEISCQPNQLPGNLIFVNDKRLSPEELVRLQGCRNPPKKLKPGRYWYDNVSGFWGKEGHKPCQIISPQLNVGGHINRDASKGDTNILINGREITKLEAFVLQLAGVPCEGNLHYWVNADGSYQEEGMNKVKGKIWDKTSIKLVCNVLSLPIPSDCANVSADEVNTQNSVEEKMPSKLVLVGYHKSGTSTIFKQAKLLYNVPFSEDERQNIKFMIQSKLYSYLGILLEGREWFEEECLLEKSKGKGQLLDEPGPSGNASRLNNKTKYSIGPRLKSFADWLIKAMVSGNLEAIFPAATREYAPFVEELWKDPAIQATYDRRNEIEMLPRSALSSLRSMALCGVGLSPSFESFEVVCVGGNLSARRIRPSLMRAIGKSSDWKRRPCLGVRCSSLKLDGNAQTDISVPVEEESGHVIKFKMSDFKVLDRVSVGLGGRAGEVVFEAVVKDTDSPLYNTQVVLRRLTSVRAQRRGKRAIEVLKKLARRRLMYHSYSMQVHGYISSAISSGRSSFTLVHGYHGSFSLRHWLQQSDWLPTLEATLALDKESVRRVGDDTVGGSAVSRQLRMIRILMRDLLIGVNYLHSHGLAHTELRLENVHISPVDRHIKVGILGNAADFYDDSPNCGTADNNMDRRQMMIAFDMRCLGFMMAKMVLRELMDPLIFTKFKSFLTKGNDPSCLREFLLQILHRNSSSGNAGLQILDRNWGAGWNLLSLLLATEPSKRVSCLDALTHPFLCGPRWRVVPSIDIIRWGLGSTALRISEEYIYGQPQRSRLSHFIELMEMLNPNSRPKNWLELLPGKWRLLYCTGRHIGLTFRQPPEQVLIGHVHLTVSRVSKLNTSLLFASDIGFTVMIGQDWPHDKAGVDGKLQVNSLFRLMAGRRLYLKEEEKNTEKLSNPSNTRDAFAQKLSGRKWKKALPFKESPSSLPVAKLVSSGIDEVTMNLGDPLSKSINSATNVVREVRTQVPPEMFDLSKLVCGTYVDTRLLVIRGVNGSALLFTRSCFDESCK